MAAKIRSSVSSLFADYHSLRVIAEPGRYFACSTHVLAVNVISKRCKTKGSSKVCVLSYVHINLSNNDEFEYTKVYDYYINDGAYGSFRHEYNRLFTPKVLKVYS